MGSPETINNYPLYIPSKGRSDCCLTSLALKEMGIEHNVVVEEQEAELYRQNLPHANIIVLDNSFKESYNTCDNYGLTKSPGPGPARNFIWEHSIKNGHDWHWVMDDNIKFFCEWNKGKRTKTTLNIFRKMEDFCSKFDNLAMAGPCYSMFAFRQDMEKMKPFILNTRIYSCNLIRNDLPFRWRGRYNEDTILSLDMLSHGWCTMQFYAYLQNKLRTQTLKGGNSAEFYSKEGTLPKSAMQIKEYPGVSKLVWRFGRWHHAVNYNKFKNNKLILKTKP